MEKFEKIRKEYPGLEHQAYLDTSTTGLISKKSYEAMRKYLDQRHFTGVTLSEYWANWAYADKVRASLAEMINADAKEVFYGKDCSDMINVFVSKVDIPAKANVVIPDISFPSTRNAWLNRVSDGLEVRYVKNNNGIVTTEQIVEAMDEKTLAVSVCSVEPSSGFRYDLYELGRVCKERNVYLVVDATQSLGAMELDVQEMNIDVMVASTYKWLNNVFGIGVGFIRKELLVKIVPNHMGWAGTRDRIKDFTNLELTINEGAKRFETGGLNWMGLSGLAESIKTYLSLGKRDVEDHILALVDVLYRGIEGLEKVKLLPSIPLRNRSNIVYLMAAETNHLTEDDFRAKGIRVNLSGSKIRVGIHFYNNESDLKSLIDYLKVLNAKIKKKDWK